MSPNFMPRIDFLKNEIDGIFAGSIFKKHTRKIATIDSHKRNWVERTGQK